MSRFGECNRMITFSYSSKTNNSQQIENEYQEAG